MGSPPQVCFTPGSDRNSDIAGGPVRANKRHRATTEGRLLLSFAEQLAGENIDEVHLSDDDKPLD
jgi:hypothetical protein